jgi:putative transposase
MKVISQIKLTPDLAQAQALKATLEQINFACNQISEVAWNEKLFQQVSLHRRVYRRVREKFELSAQVVVRCIAKVVDAYRLDKKTQRSFKKHGSLAYDARILTYFQNKKEVSIWVLGLGRIKIPYCAGKRQLRFLQYQQGESDLVYRDGSWYLHACCNVEEPEPYYPEDLLGVDLGVANIAVTSDGKRVASKSVEENRVWYRDRRKVLQEVGTKSSRRRLKQLSGRQANFQRDINHRISKELVVLAKRTKRAIALEDLKGIGSRTRVRGRDNRAKHSNWSFFQLRSFVEYKAKGTGVPVVLVDPHYTSQRCNRCGHTERANRRDQATFRCRSCGYESNADVNGARNIRDLGALNLKLSKGQRQLAYGPDGNVRDKPLPEGRGS